MFSSEQLGKLSDLLLKYLEVKSEIVKAQVKNQSIKIISSLIVLFMFMGIAFLAVLLASFTLSYYLNDILGSSYLGFAIVTGGFLVLFVFMYLGRKNIMKAWVFKSVSKYFEPENK